MNVLLILAHPDRTSFNGALADVAERTLSEQGHDVDVDDLYREQFDPVEHSVHYRLRADHEHFSPLEEQRAHYRADALPADVNREIARLEWADLVIFQFPLWWHAQPAILKGWFDRVVVYGGLYSGSQRYNRGHFLGKKAVLSVTAGSPEVAFRPFGRAGNMAEWLWPLHSSLYYVGYDVLPPHVTYGVQGGGIRYQDDAALQTQLDASKTAWSARLTRLHEEAPIPFTGWEDWDPDGTLRGAHPMRWRP